MHDWRLRLCGCTISQLQPAKRLVHRIEGAARAPSQLRGLSFGFLAAFGSATLATRRTRCRPASPLQVSRAAARLLAAATSLCPPPLHPCLPACSMADYNGVWALVPETCSSRVDPNRASVGESEGFLINRWSQYVKV